MKVLGQKYEVFSIFGSLCYMEHIWASTCPKLEAEELRECELQVQERLKLLTCSTSSHQAA